MTEATTQATAAPSVEQLQTDVRRLTVGRATAMQQRDEANNQVIDLTAALSDLKVQLESTLQQLGAMSVALDKAKGELANRASQRAGSKPKRR